MPRSPSSTLLYLSTYWLRYRIALEGPNARSRTGSSGQREIVNEFVYTVTPLHAGDIELPPLTVAGDKAGNGYGYGRSGNGHFKVTSRDPVRLQVRPAMASVRPWLPLQDLSLNATLDGGGEVEEGQPVTLALELTATGATGSQLPSLEPMLRNADFRVYREQTLTEGKLSADGHRLEGKRTEYYTLVPRSGGKLTAARDPARLVECHHGYAGARRSAHPDPEGGGGEQDPRVFLHRAKHGRRRGSWFWLPLTGLALLLVGYWGGVWYKGQIQIRPRTMGAIGRALGYRCRSAAARASEPTATAAAGTSRGASTRRPCSPASDRV